MIQSSFHLLQNNALPFSVNNTNNCTTLPSENKKNLVHDRIFDYLIQKGIVDEHGALNLNFESLMPLELKTAQIERLTSLFEKPFCVKSSNNSFEFQVTLKELYRFLKIKRSEIVGGTVFYILGKEYMEELVQILEIPQELLTDDFYAEFEKPAADIDIRVDVLDDPEKWKDQILSFFATKLRKQTKYKSWSIEELKSLVQDKGFVKYFTTPPSQSCHYGITSFGNRQDFLVDLLFVKSMKRKNLFKHDALKLYIDSSRPVRTVELQTNQRFILESLILKLTKTLDALDVNEIDLMGCGMLFTYLTKGWRCRSLELENTLASKSLTPENFPSLIKTVRSHFPNVPFAPLIFCFNACSLLPKELKNQITPLIKTLLKNPVENIKQSEIFLKLFQDTFLSVASEIEFKLLTAYFQIFGTVFPFLNKKSVQNMGVTVSENESSLQFKFQSERALHITFKNDLNGAIRTLKEHADSLDLGFKHQFSLLFKILSKCFTADLQEEILPQTSTAFDLLELKDHALNQIGFYLLCLSGEAEKTDKYFPTLLTKFIDLVSSETSSNSRKNLTDFFLKYCIQCGPDEACKFYKTIAHPESTPENILKSFCLNFAKIENPYLTKAIFDLAIYTEILNDQAKFELIEKCAKHSPRMALKMLRPLIAKNMIQKSKKALDLILKYYQKLPSFDLDLLTETALEILAKIDKYKTVPKKEETEGYVQLALKALEIDVAKGTELVKSLENKNAIAKGSIEIASPPPIQPLKKLSPEETLKSWLTSITDENSAKNRGLEIFRLLQNITATKPQVSNKLKELVKPKLEWILTHVLTLHQEVNREWLSSCFRVMELCDHQTVLILPVLKELLNSDSSAENVRFVHEKLKQLHPVKDLRFLILSALDNEQIAIADEILRRSLKTTSPLELELFIKRLLDIYTDKKLHVPLLSFLNFLENFQIDVTSYWKELLLNCDKKQALFLKKAPLFLADSDVLAKVEMHTLSFLNNAKEAKGRVKEEFFNEASKLIEAYKLQSANLIEELSATLLSLNNKNLSRAVYQTLRKVGTPLSRLIPLFKIFLIINPEIFATFASEVGSFLEEFGPQACTHEKSEFMHTLASGILNLLKQKNPDYLKIYEAYGHIEQALINSFFLTHEQIIELNFKFAKGFIHVDNHDMNLSFWAVLNSISVYAITEEEKNQLISLFIDSYPFCERTASTYLSCVATSVSIMRHVNAANLPFVLDLILKNNSSKLFNFGSRCIVKVIDECTNKDADAHLDAVYIPLSEALKKFINACIDGGYFLTLGQIISPKLFTIKEFYEFHGKVSHALFNDPETIKNDQKIRNALDIYSLNIKSPHESADFQESNMIKAVDHLVALLLPEEGAVQNVDIFNEYLDKIVQSLMPYVENQKEYLQFVASIGEMYDIPPYLKNKPLEKPAEISASDRAIMQQKLSRFLLLLTDKISEKTFAAPENAINAFVAVFALNNFFHLIFLIKFAPEKSGELMASSLNYCYALTRLNYGLLERSIKYAEQIVDLMIKVGFGVATVEEFGITFKLMAFSNLSLKTFHQMSDSDQASHILGLVKKILKPRTLQAYVVAFDYLDTFTRTS